jgi:hypothetical protein
MDYYLLDLWYMVVTLDFGDAKMCYLIMCIDVLFNDIIDVLFDGV